MCICMPMVHACVLCVHVCACMSVHVYVLLPGAFMCIVHVCWCMYVCCVYTFAHIYTCVCLHAACMCLYTPGWCITAHAFPLFSAVRHWVQQPPADPPWPGAGTPEEVARSAAGGGLCQGPQAAGRFPEEWTAQYLFYPDKKCYFQRRAEARGSKNAAARLL